MKYIFSYSIIIGVSGIILSSSFWIMKISLNKENNWELLSKIYNSNIAVALSPSEEKVDLTESEKVISKNECSGQTEVERENSLVDYLLKKKQKNSFLERAKLAEQFNIKNYSGSASQNLLILRKLQEQENFCKEKENTKNIIIPTITNLNLVNNL